MGEIRRAVVNARSALMTAMADQRDIAFVAGASIRRCRATLRNAISALSSVRGAH